MSLLRSTERLLEGNIGEVEVIPLIAYPITIFELSILSNISIPDSLIPYINMQGRVNTYGIKEINNQSNIAFSDFIRSEVMKFWGLPKKLSIKLYEQEYEDIYVIRPRIVEDYLVVNIVAPIHINYCQDSYSLGLGEDKEIIETKYWKYNYIDSIKVYDIDNNWIQWISF